MRTINKNDYVYVHITTEGWRHIEMTVSNILVAELRLRYERINDIDHWKMKLWEVFWYLSADHNELLYDTRFLLK